jgi:hypothetical protein
VLERGFGQCETKIVTGVESDGTPPSQDGRPLRSITLRHRERKAMLQRRDHVGRETTRVASSDGRQGTSEPLNLIGMRRRCSPESQLRISRRRLAYGVRLKKRCERSWNR